MGAILRDTALYGKLYTSKYVADKRDFGGFPIMIPIELIGLSPAVLGDTYNVCLIKAFFSVMSLFLQTDGLGSSVTVALGDSSSAARYLAATSFATTGLSTTALAVGAQNFRPTADTIVVAVGAGAAFTVGKKLLGYFLALAPA